jgi:hypothetical protein
MSTMQTLNLTQYRLLSYTANLVCHYLFASQATQSTYHKQVVMPAQLFSLQQHDGDTKPMPVLFSVEA